METITCPSCGSQLAVTPNQDDERCPCGREFLLFWEDVSAATEPKGKRWALLEVTNLDARAARHGQ